MPEKWKVLYYQQFLFGKYELQHSLGIISFEIARFLN